MNEEALELIKEIEKTLDETNKSPHYYGDMNVDNMIQIMQLIELRKTREEIFSLTQKLDEIKRLEFF